MIRWKETDAVAYREPASRPWLLALVLVHSGGGGEGSGGAWRGVAGRGGAGREAAGP